MSFRLFSRSVFPMVNVFARFLLVTAYKNSSFRRSYSKYLRQARFRGYRITLIFFRQKQSVYDVLSRDGWLIPYGH
jgi:hypothetical protein